MSTSPDPHALPSPTAAGADLFAYGAALLLAVVVFLSRVAWISAAYGYGLDADAYRVVLASRSLAETGEYTMSRAPGNPLYEYLVALTVDHSPAFSNGLAAVSSALAAGFLALILRALRVRPFLSLALGFAFTPVVFIQSTCTMDYMTALALGLGATHFVLARRPLLAGMLLGLAIGCRITSGAMLLPLLAWLVSDRNDSERWRSGWKLTSATLVTGALCFVPVVRRYGLTFLSFYDPPVDRSLGALLDQGLLEVWGGLGSLDLLALGVAAIVGWRRLARAWGDVESRRVLVLALLVVALYGASFVRLPHEAAYLLPAVPFLLLAVGRLAPPSLARGFAGVLVLSSFVSVTTRGFAAGPIFEDGALRRAQIGETEQVISTVESLDGAALIVAGAALPAIQVTLGSDRQGKHRYVYLLEKAETPLQSDGAERALYYLPGADDLNQRARGINLGELGAVPLGLRAWVGPRR